MKNEDRIIEILAEALRKLDQHSELFLKLGLALEKQGSILEKQGSILEKQGSVLEKQSEIMIGLLNGQNQITNELTGLRTDFHKMNDHLLNRQDNSESRIGRLEDKVFK